MTHLILSSYYQFCFVSIETEQVQLIAIFVINNTRVLLILWKINDTNCLYSFTCSHRPVGALSWQDTGQDHSVETE